ncbi:hypothetical protein ETU09_00420 [Apibacter muscae]|uniref:Uncharacterized protein n=1 Tax=Apibacter muscae TaxID=2509004 RepID=A0A563DJS7_9FLAO|nr:hypothetical protein [Apibacter muscae]TWP30498.1 hypothetical protein ETU09_00420 [Apibacter muscae]
MEINKKLIKTKNLGNIVIKRVSKQIAKELIIKNHYSHKWNDGGFGLYNFGIFQEGEEEENQCIGVAVYGYMKNLKAKLFKHNNPQAWIIELNRMWIDDCLGKNAESLLIAHSLQMLKKLDKNIVAVQSFADGRLGCGTIYKASNFKYFGFHYTRFLKNKRTQEIIHDQNFTNTKQRSAYLRNNMAFLLGDFTVFKTKTYRYIYVFDKRTELKFNEKQYPPYEKGIEEITLIRNKELIKQRLTNFINEL